MNDALAMGLLLAVLAALLVTVFLATWVRDRRRAEDVSRDRERLDVEPPS